MGQPFAGPTCGETADAAGASNPPTGAKSEPLSAARMISMVLTLLTTCFTSQSESTKKEMLRQGHAAQRVLAASRRCLLVDLGVGNNTFQNL